MLNKNSFKELFFGLDFLQIRCFTIFGYFCLKKIFVFLEINDFRRPWKWIFKNEFSFSIIDWVPAECHHAAVGVVANKSLQFIGRQTCNWLRQKIVNELNFCFDSFSHKADELFF